MCNAYIFISVFTEVPPSSSFSVPAQVPGQPDEALKPAKGDYSALSSSEFGPAVKFLTRAVVDSLFEEDVDLVSEGTDW